LLRFRGMKVESRMFHFEHPKSVVSIALRLWDGHTLRNEARGQVRGSEEPTVGQASQNRFEFEYLLSVRVGLLAKFTNGVAQQIRA
jgi:hypothetical protein